MSESRAIDLDFKLLSDKIEEFTPASSANAVPKKPKNLSVYDVRTLSGCLVRVPDNFYTTMWQILSKAQGGIRIADQFLPQEPTITELTSTEMSFAYQFEMMLNEYNVKFSNYVINSGTKRNHECS